MHSSECTVSSKRILPPLKSAQCRQYTTDMLLTYSWKTKVKVAASVELCSGLSNRCVLLTDRQTYDIHYIQNMFRIISKIWSNLVRSIIYPKFHESSPTIFWVILLTNRQFGVFTSNEQHRFLVAVQLHLTSYPTPIEVSVPPARHGYVRQPMRIRRLREGNAEIALLGLSRLVSRCRLWCSRRFLLGCQTWSQITQQLYWID